MPQADSKVLLRGALILTIAGILTKILSAIYRIPFQNIVGDIGFYIYQQIYPFYGIAIALATYGFPVIISKIIAENEDDGDSNRKEQIIQSSFIILVFTGLLLFLILYLGANYIAGWMGDSQLVSLIKITSISFLIMPFISTIRGYFQGNGIMIPTAVSQVIEQSIRVTAILVVAIVFMKKGFTLYRVGEGALIGSIIGGLSALIILFIFYFKHQKPKLYLPKTRFFLYVGKTLLIQGIAVCISGMLLVLFQLIDSLNIYSLLIQSGVEEMKAKELKGIFDRGQPLIQLGTVVSTSLSMTLVPLITSEFKKGNQDALVEKVHIAIKISFIVGVGATVGLVNIIEPTNTLLFSDSKGSNVIGVFAIAIFFSSIIVTIIGILQGMGKIIIPSAFVLLGMAIKWFGNQLLIPVFGTMGASMATITALALILVLFLYMLFRLDIHIKLSRFYMSILFSSVIMTLVLRVWCFVFDYGNLNTREWSAVESLGGVAIGGVVYILVIGYFKPFTREELNYIPLGRLLRLFS